MDISPLKAIPDQKSPEYSRRVSCRRTSITSISDSTGTRSLRESPPSGKRKEYMSNSNTLSDEGSGSHRSSSVPSTHRKISTVNSGFTFGKSASCVPEERRFSVSIGPEKKNCGICCWCCYKFIPSKKIPFITKKLCVSNTCCCFIVLLFFFALMSVVSLSASVGYQISDYIHQQEVNLGTQVESIIEASFEHNEMHFSSLVGYFYGSQFVDYEEFGGFLKYSHMISHDFSSSVSWFTTIPQKYSGILKENIETNKFKLPKEELSNLNNSQFLEEYNHIRTYAFPSYSKSIGKSYDNDEGGKLADILFTNYSSSNPEKMNYFRKLKLDSESYPHVEYHIPILKSNLNESLGLGYQNGILLFSADFIEMFFLDAGTIFNVDISVVVIDSKGEKCVKNCDIYSENMDEILAYTTDHCYVDVLFSDQFLDHFDKKILRFYLFHEDNFNVTPYDTQLALSIIVPFFVAFVLSLSACFSWFYIINNIRANEQLSAFEEVALSVAFLDFDSKIVRKFLSKRRPKRVEKILIRIISFLRQFKTYMPSTLINQIDGLQDSVSDCSSTGSNTSNSSSNSSGTGKSPTRSDAIDKLSRRRHSIDDKSLFSKILGGIKSKNICILFVGLRNSEILRLTLGKVENFISLVNDYHSIVFSIVKRNGGSFHRFSGFEMLFSFGAVTNRMSSSNDAVSSSWEILKNKKLEDLGISVCCGIGRCDSLCGDFPIYCQKDGSIESRQFDFLNSKINQHTIETIEALKNLNELYNSRILISEDIYEDVKFRSDCKLLDYVKFKKCGKLVSEEIHRLYELVDLSKVSDNEWMYEIEDSRTDITDCFEVLETCWFDIEDGVFEEALKKIGEFLGKEENGKYEVHFKNILSVIGKMENGNSDFCTVIEIC